MGAVCMPKAACSEEWNQILHIAAEIDFNKTVHPSLWTKKQAKKWALEVKWSVCQSYYNNYHFPTINYGTCKERSKYDQYTGENQVTQLPLREPTLDWAWI